MKNKFFGFIQSAGVIILLCFIVAEIIYTFVFGNPANFMDGDPANAPMPGNLLGTIHKGGFIVPIILTLLLTVLTISVERFFTIRRAKGKGDLTSFITKIKASLAKGDIKEANQLCAKQGGTVANVVKSALMKYEQMEHEDSLTKDQKMSNIQQQVEEATALELPILEQNLVVVATITTLGTLMGLLGTVIGMIRSFASLATAGGTDSVALSTGISEALVNTAFGIATGALAVISYNYFTSKIDKITFCIDEVGYTLVQTYASSHK
ncbi:MAG: MotA/TolQ/ExbB proton channel family protein [Bacteroidales bacterium]